MSKSYDDEIPASTLGGAQDKFVVQRIDGRYVPVEPPRSLHIPSWPAPDIDPAKLATFTNEPGPPSIVETIIDNGPLWDPPLRDPKPLLRSAPTPILLEVRAKLKAAAAADQELLKRGEISADEAVAAIKLRYGELEHDNAYQAGLKEEAAQRLQGFFDAGELITADELCSRLDISPQDLDRAIRERRMFYVPGLDHETWYPAFFADPYRLDVERVSVALGEIDGLKKWQFFIEPRWLLGGETGLVSLQLENHEMVMRAAAAFAERCRNYSDD